MGTEAVHPGGEDYDYIIKVIQHLESKHGLVFFITSSDFNVLYRWWEKRIPFRVIEESLGSVVRRWTEKKKQIHSFSNFYREVKKNFKAFLELSVGAEGRQERAKENEYEEIEQFLADYPAKLLEIRGEFESVFKQLKAGEALALDTLHEQLLAMFADDRELDMKTELFRKNLAPELRTAEIERRYRLNWLKNRYHIPDFDLYRDQ